MPGVMTLSCFDAFEHLADELIFKYSSGAKPYISSSDNYIYNYFLKDHNETCCMFV